MADEEGLVNRDILDRHNPLFALKVDHPVDEQHRIAMRKNPHNVIDVVVDVLGGWNYRDFSGFGHWWRVISLHGIASWGSDSRRDMLGYLIEHYTLLLHICRQAA
jgi:hypothetical protein